MRPLLSTVVSGWVGSGGSRVIEDHVDIKLISKVCEVCADTIFIIYRWVYLCLLKQLGRNGKG